MFSVKINDNNPLNYIAFVVCKLSPTDSFHLEFFLFPQEIALIFLQSPLNLKYQKT